MRVVLESQGFEILAGEVTLLPGDPDESKGKQLEFASVPLEGNTVSDFSIEQPGDYLPILTALKGRTGAGEIVTVDGLTLPAVAITNDNIEHGECLVSVPSFGLLQVKVMDSQGLPLPEQSVEISSPGEIAGGQTDATGNFQLFLTVGSYRVTVIGGQEAEVTVRSFEDSHIVLRGPARRHAAG